MNKIQSWMYSSYEQTIQINELLGSSESYYTLYDIFSILPKEYIFDCKRGDIFVSHTEISYSNITAEWKLNLLKSFEIPLNGDIYDAFISALNYFIYETDWKPEI